jgi:hypothetical protein
MVLEGLVLEAESARLPSGFLASVNFDSYIGLLALP